VKYSRRGTRQEVAPPLIVVQGGCKENEGPAIILCDLATSKPGGRARTPQKYLLQLGVSCQGAERARQHSNECYPHDDQTASKSKSHAANTERRSDRNGESRRNAESVGATRMSPANAGMHVSSGMDAAGKRRRRRSNRDVAGQSRNGCFISRDGCFVSPASTGTYASDRPSSIRPTALTDPSYSVPRGIV
jgi:hypothetical protein